MPTAAKLSAAALFALVAFVSAQLFIPAMPQGSAIGYFREISTGIGLVVGWFFMGKRAGQGYAVSISAGIQSSLVLLFWVLLVFGSVAMYYKSVRMMYDGPMEAVLGVFDEMLTYAKMLAAPATPIALAVGGALAGMVIEWVDRRWS